MLRKPSRDSSPTSLPILLSGNYSSDATSVTSVYEARTKKKLSPLPLSSMPVSPNLRWWKQVLGQCISWPGLTCFLTIITRDPHLSLLHIAVVDIYFIDWAELSYLCFKGIIFDKDNSLTALYSVVLWSPLCCCRSILPDHIVVFSNSAGMYQYDLDGVEARVADEVIGGVYVIRHEIKKLAGIIEEMKSTSVVHPHFLLWLEIGTLKHLGGETPMFLSVDL